MFSRHVGCPMESKILSIHELFLRKDEKQTTNEHCAEEAGTERLHKPVSSDLITGMTEEQHMLPERVGPT